MHFTKFFTFTLIGLWFSQIGAQEPNSSEKAKKVVFIIVDGIATDMLKSNATPQLDAITQDGDYTDAYVGGLKDGYSKTPTISAVGYNSLLTGVWANKHNVWGNGIKAPNYNYPTIFRLYKDNIPEGKTAVFSTWLDNRTKLIGEGLPQTNNLKVDYAFDGFELDTISFPHDPESNYIKNIDTHVATQAASYIKTKAPDLSWVYLQYPDNMGHMYGDSPELTAAIKYEDSLIGSIYEAVKYREENHNEDWLFLVTTDHGRSPKDGKHHGGQSERERSIWIVTNSKNTNSYFKKQTPAIVDLLPTMTSFLELDITDATRSEWDGVSFIDPVDFTQIKTKVTNNNIVITWKNLGKNSTPIKVYTSATNKAKIGGKDNYQKAGNTKTGKEIFIIPLKDGEKPPMKILLKSERTTRNAWISHNPK